MKNLTLTSKTCIPSTPLLMDTDPLILERRILKKAAMASARYGLLKKNDRVLAAISGGKDSWTMLHALIELRKKAPFSYEIHVVVVQQGAERFRTDIIEKRVSKLPVDGFEILHYPVFEVVRLKNRKGKISCSLCSRLRRGILYSYAAENGFNKIALGHHLDDVIETLLLNVFFEGKIGAMAPIRSSDDGRNIIIRPLYFVEERETATFVYHKRYPVVCCHCPLCHEKFSSKRALIKQWIAQMEKEYPGIKRSLLASLENIDVKGITWFLKGNNNGYERTSDKGA